MLGSFAIRNIRLYDAAQPQKVCCERITLCQLRPLSEKRKFILAFCRRRLGVIERCYSTYVLTEHTVPGFYLKSSNRLECNNQSL